MANGHGGARQGAGRKQKKIKYAGRIAKAEKRIADRLVDLVDRAFELAEGVPIIQGLPLEAELARLRKLAEQAREISGDTAELAEITEQLNSTAENLKHIYRSEPNFKALEYLLNRIMGKPVEKKEITGENGGAIPLDIEISFGGGETDAETES